MSAAFSVDGKASAVSATEPNCDCCVFVLDVSAVTLDAEQTPDQGQHTARGTDEPVACWVKRSGEIAGWIMTNCHALRM